MKKIMKIMKIHAFHQVLHLIFTLTTQSGEGNGTLSSQSFLLWPQKSMFEIYYNTLTHFFVVSVHRLFFVNSLTLNAFIT